jgi:hypothetical protein
MTTTARLPQPLHSLTHSLPPTTTTTLLLAPSPPIMKDTSSPLHSLTSDDHDHPLPLLHLPQWPTPPPVHLPHSQEPPTPPSLSLWQQRPPHHPMHSLGCRVGHTLMMARRWMERWWAVGDRNTSTDTPRSLRLVVPTANWQGNSEGVVWLEGQGQECHFYVVPPPCVDTVEWIKIRYYKSIKFIVVNSECSLVVMSTTS